MVVFWIFIGLIYTYGVIAAFRMMNARGGELAELSPTESDEMIFVFMWFSWVTVLCIKYILDPKWLQQHTTVSRYQ